MGKAYNYKHAPAGRWRIGNTHPRSAEGLEPPTRARCAHATNAQKEPRFPRSNHERTLVFPSQSTRNRDPARPAAAGSVTWLRKQRACGLATWVLAHRPEAAATPTGRALRTWLATRSRLGSKVSGAPRWVQIRPGPGTPTDDAGQAPLPQPSARATATSAFKAHAALLLLGPNYPPDYRCRKR